MAADDVTAQQIKRLVADRQYPEAVRACRRALLSRPENVPIRLLLGVSLLALQRHEEVRSEMLVILRTHPKEAMAYRILGEAYLNDGRPGRAQAPLKQAIALAPEDVEAVRLLKDAQARDTGEEEEADTLDRWFDPEAVATIQRHVDEPDDMETRRGEVLGRGRMPSSAGTSSPGISRSPSRRPAASPVQPLPRASQPPPSSAGGRRAPSSAGSQRTPSSAGSSKAPPPPSSVRPSSPGAKSAPPPVPSAKPSRPPSMPPRLPSQPAPSKPGEGRGNVYAGRTASGLAAPRLPTGVGGGTGELEPAPLPRTSEAGGLRSPPAGLFRPSSPGFAAPKAPSPAPFEHEPFGADDDEKATEIMDRDALYAGVDLGAVTRHTDDEDTAGKAPSLTPRAGGSKAPSPFLAGGTTEVDSPPQVPGPGSAETAPEAELPRHSGGLAFPATPQWTPSTSGSAPRGSAAAAAERALFDPSAGSYHTVVKGKPRWPLRTKILVLAVAGLVTVAVLFFVAAVRTAQQSRAAQAAVTTALRDGRPSVWTKAVAEAKKLDGDAVRGVGAELLAIALYEQGMGTVDQVERKIARAGDRDPISVRLARTYLALAEGDIVGAEGALGTVAEGAPAEAWYAQALVRSERGDFPGALASARQALTMDPESARYAVLRTWLEARNDPRAVTEPLLAAIAGGEARPAVRIARARIAALTLDPDHLAGSEADAVRDRLRADATPRELAWAHALVARDALRLGDREHARASAQEALAVPNVGPDSALFGEVAVDLVRARDGKGALDALARVPKDVLASPEWRAVEASAHLELGDVAKAEALLAEASKDGYADYYRGRVLELKGNRTAAAAAYAKGVLDSRTASDATAALATLRFDDGDTKGALSALDALPAGALVTDAMEALRVRILVKLGKRADAESRLAAARKSRPESTALRLAQAELWLAAGKVDEAWAEARTLAAAPDADLVAVRLLGRAALLTGHLEDAEKAFQTVIAKVPNDAAAKEGLAQIALGRDDFDKAEAYLADFGDVNDPDLLRVRGQLLVIKGAGKVAADMLAPFAAKSKDPELLNAYATALFQSEEENRAQKIWSKVLTLDKRNPEAELGTALVIMRGGNLGTVESHLAVAEKESKARNMSVFFAARLVAARARLAYEFGNLKLAETRAEEALKLYPRLGEAHHVLADVEIDRNGRPVAHLTAARDGVMTPPEALGQLALRTSGPEACALAKRYLQLDPTGFDAKRVAAVAKRCR